MNFRTLRLIGLILAASAALAACASAQQNATDNPEFAPWDKNSIQPPPEVKIERPDLPTAPQAADGESERVLRAAVAWFDEAIKRVDVLVSGAEAAAEGLINGGTVYAAGSPGFIQELYGRAGGLGCLREWEGQQTTPNDVLLIGQFTPRDEGSNRINTPSLLSGGGWNIKGTVVHFASHNWVKMARMLPMNRRSNWQNRLYLVDTAAPEGGTWSDVSLGQMAAAATAWAFTGEMFAAATRKGKTLATLASDVEPNGPAFDKSVEGKVLNDRYTVPPIGAGETARTYLMTCRNQLADFLAAGECAKARLAGERLAKTLKAGGAAMVLAGGHIHLRGDIVPLTFPRLVMWGRTWEWRDAALKEGDMLLYIAYLDYPTRTIEGVLKRGGNVVTLAAADGPTDESRVNIRGFWKPWDSCVNIKGYPVRILPSSGVVQTVHWYALIAEAEKAFGK